MKRIALILVVLLFLSGMAYGQESRFQTGGSITVMSPQDAFADYVDNLGFGLTGFFAYRFPQSPVLAGASFGFNIYGSNSWEEPLISTVPVYVDVTTTNALINGFVFIRLEPMESKIRPYVDALLGFNYLTTDTSIEDDDDFEEIASSKNYDDITHAYGIGAGLHIQVWQAKPVSEGPGKVHIDLGIRYIRGGEARYLKKGDIESLEGGGFKYHLNNSTTNLLSYHIGVSVDI